METPIYSQLVRNIDKATEGLQLVSEVSREGVGPSKQGGGGPWGLSP